MSITINSIFWTMYNGRQWHIQTESIQDQSVKEESVHGHRNGGKALWDVSRTKFPATKTKHLAEREMYKEQKKKKKTASAHHKKKNKSSMQCYIWFHGCKLDCIHVTIAYAIR